MVVSIHHDASDAGLKMLQAGGNAVDAAVATGFALAVVYPDAGNLGGGGFMMLRMANGESHFLDFREEAPLRATANMYLDGRWQDHSRGFHGWLFVCRRSGHSGRAGRSGAALWQAHAAASDGSGD